MRGRVGRFVGALVIGMVAPVVLLVASQLLAGALGTFDLDLTLRQAVIDHELPVDTPLPQVWLAFGGQAADRDGPRRRNQPDPRPG